MTRLREYWQRLHRNDRPSGLWFLMIFGGLLAAPFCLALVTAPLNLGLVPFGVRGDDVPGREFVAELGILSWIARSRSIVYTSNAVTKQIEIESSGNSACALGLRTVIKIDVSVGSSSPRCGTLLNREE